MDILLFFEISDNLMFFFFCITLRESICTPHYHSVYVRRDDLRRARQTLDTDERVVVPAQQENLFFDVRVPHERLVVEAG